MNLIRKDVLRLKKVLIQRLIAFLSDEGIEPGDHISIPRISQAFWFNDGRELDQHADDHGQGLSEESVEYLFRQADGTFEEQFQVVKGTGKTYWVMKPLKARSTVREADGTAGQA